MTYWLHNTPEAEVKWSEYARLLETGTRTDADNARIAELRHDPALSITHEESLRHLAMLDRIEKEFGA